MDGTKPMGDRPQGAGADFCDEGQW